MKSDGSNHKADIVYTVDDVPPWYLCIALGFQVCSYPVYHQTIENLAFFGYLVLFKMLLAKDVYNPGIKSLHTFTGN